VATVYDVKPDALITETAKNLKENIKLAKPDWAENVKTGTNKERAPDDPDWWWVRGASLLRRIYVDGPVGVERLRVHYGGRKRRGRRPPEFRKSGGKILRALLQEFDKQGFTEKVGGTGGGRKVTGKGQKYLDNIASKILVSQKDAGHRGD